MIAARECDQLIRDGMMKNQSELAHYAQVTTARMTHIMWLTNLAPKIQEAILFLPRVESGPDTVKEIDVRRIARVMGHGGQNDLLANHVLMFVGFRNCLPSLAFNTLLQILDGHSLLPHVNILGNDYGRCLIEKACKH